MQRRDAAWSNRVICIREPAGLVTSRYSLSPKLELSTLSKRQLNKILNAFKANTRKRKSKWIILKVNLSSQLLNITNKRKSLKTWRHPYLFNRVQSRLCNPSCLMNKATIVNQRLKAIEMLAFRSRKLEMTFWIWTSQSSTELHSSHWFYLQLCIELN